MAAVQGYTGNRLMIDVRPDSKRNSFRAARVNLLRTMIGQVLEAKDTCSILDIGGTYNFWHIWQDSIDWDRTTITCVNRDPSHAEGGKGGTRIQMARGDATNLSGFNDNQYDIAFSNSVIEHVGTWPQMSAMAAEVRRVAPRYLVQTPNYWFPVEPHARTPFLHWLPEPWAYRIVMARRCGYWARQDTVSGAVRMVQSAKLIDAAQMRELFSDARIIRERYFGLTKSLIALKDS